MSEQNDTLQSILSKYEGSPSQEQIEKWKLTHGDVFVSGFSETELFVWRSLKRQEWIKLQSLVSNPDNNINQFKFEEMVCEQCVLWKSDKNSWEDGKAGTTTSLHEQIMQNSNFLNPQAASMLVAKL
jgi:hypothetical protein